MKLAQVLLRLLSYLGFPALIIAVLFLRTPCVSAETPYYFLLWILPLFVTVNWINWKLPGAIAALTATCILTVYISMLNNSAECLLPIVPAVLLFVFIAVHQYSVAKSMTSLDLKLDEQERSYNLLLQDYHKRELLKEAYQKKKKRFAHLSEIAKDLNLNLDSNDIYKKIVDNLLKTIDNGDVYYIWEIGKDMQTLSLKALTSPLGISTPDAIASDVFNVWTLRHRQPLLVSNAMKDYRFTIHESIPKCVITAPLMTGDKIMGIIRIDSNKPDTFSVDDLRLLAIVANIAASNIYNLSLFRETEYLATRDGLTDLLVKRSFYEKLNALLAEAKSSGNIFSLLLLDFDRFKELNDKHGHSVGDKVLQKTAAIIRETAGINSICARYGGEEFGVLLPNMPKKEARHIAENIRYNIESETFLVRREGLSMTISIGVSEALTDGISPEEIIEKADKALYQAKHKGRNMVVMA